MRHIINYHRVTQKMSMTNKRIEIISKVKMSSFVRVKPVQVSPTIKAVRWGLLMCGVVHGMSRRKRLKEFEKTEHVIREQKLKEKYEKLAIEGKIRATREVLEIAKDFEVTEFPPGWDEDI